MFGKDKVGSSRWPEKKLLHWIRHKMKRIKTWEMAMENFTESAELDGDNWEARVKNDSEIL